MCGFPGLLYIDFVCYFIIVEADNTLERKLLQVLTTVITNWMLIL